MHHRFAPVALRVLRALTAIVVAACGGASPDRPSEPPAPVVPQAPKPSIVISSDSVVASLVAGAASFTSDIDVTPGNETLVSSLAVSDSGTASGQSAWLTATLSSSTAPAKITVRLSPAAVAAGRYDATLRVTAANAEPKSIRVSLVVRPRPRLVLAQSSVALSGDVGSGFAPATIDLTSVNGPIDSIRVSQPNCGGGPSNWLAASLSSANAPASLRLTYATQSLVAGAYSCAFVVSTSQALVDSASQTVRVSLSLRGVPRIAVVDTVNLSAYRLADVSPVNFQITNAGTGTLTGLSVGAIAYGAGGSGWLTATIDSATAPTTLTLVASAKSLASGSYVATLPIESVAEGVANSPSHVVVKFTVLPRPSSLITNPSVMNLTVKAGTSTHVTLSVTHTGDSPLRHMGFSQSQIFPWQPWIQPSLGCISTEFVTPCTGRFDLVPPSATAPGNYSMIVRYQEFITNLTATVTLNVKVIP